MKLPVGDDVHPHTEQSAMNAIILEGLGRASLMVPLVSFATRVPGTELSPNRIKF